MKSGVYVILAVKNKGKEAKGLLTSILFKIMYGKEEAIKKVILTDLDSKDNTMEVLRKFKKQNEYVNVSTWKECKEIIDMINDS